MINKYEKEDELSKKNSSTPMQKGGKVYRSSDYGNSTHSSSSSNKKVAKASINFQKVGIHSFKHNAREEEKKANTIFEEYTKENEFDVGSKDALKTFNSLYREAKKERLSRGLNKTADKKNTLWEAIVNLKTEHTLKDVQELAKKIEKETGFQTIQVAVHKDEGQEKEGKLIRKNHHAHITFFTLSKSEGQQMYRREYMNRKMLIKLQDITSEHLGMERGVRGSNVRRLGHKEYKSIMKDKEEYEKKLDILKQAIHIQRENLKEQNATRPDYAKLEQVNKDLQKELKYKALNLVDLEQEINKKVKTINYQNDRLDNFESKEKSRELTIKGEISKKRVTISKGIFNKNEEVYIYSNESVEKFIEKSKSKENHLTKKLEKLENKQVILEENNKKINEFKLFTKVHLRTSNLDRVQELIKERIPKVFKQRTITKNINYDRD